ncbi:MAG: hypothetical protein R6U13_11530 [Desulfatiglandaceae bacterium]
MNLKGNAAHQQRNQWANPPVQGLSEGKIFVWHCLKGSCEKHMKKAPYKITWENLAPPYKDYEYFSGCEQFPFNPKTKEFSMMNVWWLIEAATLSYAEEEYARKLFQKAGFPEVRYFTDKSTAPSSRSLYPCRQIKVYRQQRENS